MSDLFGNHSWFSHEVANSEEKKQFIRIRETYIGVKFIHENKTYLNEIKGAYPVISFRSKCKNTYSNIIRIEPRHEKTGFFAYAKTKAQISCAVTAQLISAFVFATRIVYFLLYLYPNFQDSMFLMWLFRLVCV